MKVLLTLMVKNESRILQRCLEAGSKHADAILVADTGSTDSTVEIARAFTELPLRVVEHPWKNFGHNRSLSFAAAYAYAKDLHWDLDDSYALVLDGDMVLRGDDPRPQLETRKAGYRLLQKNGTLEYYNTRFLRLSYPWKCRGVTHEYWDGGDSENLAGLWINDIGDGGAKADKFDRDVRLLTQGLKDEPNNVRYMFYLANTLKDMGKYDEAIEWYKKRIRAGGWNEEVWYSHYMLAKVYIRKGDPARAEMWVQRALAYRPSRAEALGMLVTHLREKGDHFKAWHYLRIAERIKKPDDLLFVEPAAYGEALDYERTILQYYVSENRGKGMDCSLAYRGSMEPSVFSNLIHYTQPLACEWERLNFPAPDGFVASSVAVDTNGRMNVRTHNYTITSQGGYTNPGTVETRNFQCDWDFAVRKHFGWKEVVCDLPRREDIIRGLEDIRVNRGMFTACTKEFSYNDAYRVVYGSYPPNADTVVVRPPVETACEKNWLPFNGDALVYQWHPLQIGRVVGGRLEITHTHPTPHWFHRARGSAPPFLYKGQLWAMVHLVQYTSPRRYMHAWVVMDEKTYAPIAYSRPFTFRHHGVEYCLSAQVSNDEVQVFVSVWDRESWVGRMPMSECVKMLVPLSSA